MYNNPYKTLETKGNLRPVFKWKLEQLHKRNITEISHLSIKKL
jgi:hypothetical protein